ncbi:MAG: hypothetical protein LBS85_01570, partial [Clostridiales Family XIII bacterium]|nr:hypothetical protein [Clostridiales Family XIII bacterium]
SYKRSLPARKAEVAISEIDDENALFIDDLDIAEEPLSELQLMDQSESLDIAQNDFVNKLSILLNHRTDATKYVGLNIKSKLSINEKMTLEKVFDIIKDNAEPEQAEMLIDAIAERY